LPFSGVEVIACKPARIGVNAIGLWVCGTWSDAKDIYESP